MVLVFNFNFADLLAEISVFAPRLGEPQIIKEAVKISENLSG